MAWFLTESGEVGDVAQGVFGTTDVQLGARVLRPGQAGAFDVAAATCPTATTPMVGQCPAYNPLFAGIRSMKVLAFVKEEDLP
jgi:hypothetical protein